MLNDLTILSANYLDADYLLLNRAHSVKFGNEPKDWFLVNNRPPEIDILKDYFKIIPGVSRSDIKRTSSVSINSYQHGWSLNKGLKYLFDNKLLTKYVMILDGDFFIFYSLAKILDEMDKRSLYFFGVPFNYPEYKKKYTFHLTPKEKTTLIPGIVGFPCTFCCIINTKLVNISKLNWSPARGDTGSQIPPIYYRCPWGVAPFAGAFDLSNRDRKTLRKEIYKHNSQLFGIHCRNRSMERKELYDGRYYLTKTYLENMDKNMPEIEWLIEQNIWGDGTWPNDKIKGDRKYQ